MPLPNVTNGIVPRCTAKSKRSGQRCLNGCVAHSKVCRMHGHRKPESVLRGSEHPAYLHGAATNEAREANRQNSLELHRLLALGKNAGIFSPEVALRGRKPNNTGYV